MKKPHVTILILNWNGYALTKECITSLLKNNYEKFSFILADNGSDGEEANKLENEFRKRKYSEVVKKHPISILRFKKNYGYAIGMNKAFTRVNSEYVLIVNNDMKFDKNYISELVRVLSSDNRIAVCQPKLLHMTEKNKFDYSVAAGGYVDIFGYPFARGRIFTHIEDDNGQYDTISKISWCGIFMAKTEILRKTGLFDPIYVNYGEDMDLCYRIYGIGKIIVNVPTSVGYHISGATLKRNLFKKMYYHHRNNLIVILKNFDTSWLIKVIFLRIVLDWVSIIYYIYKRTYTSAFGVIVAHVDVLLMIFKIFNIRKSAQKKINKRYIDVMPIYKGSIVWEYFVMKKKRFSDFNIANVLYNQRS